MARSYSIYILRKREEDKPLALFTVKYEGIAFAAQHGLRPDAYVLERVRDGDWARPEEVKEWKNDLG